MTQQLQLHRHENGETVIGLGRTLIAIDPQDVEGLVNAVIFGASSDSASLCQIYCGQHERRWALAIYEDVFWMDECDVIALKHALKRAFFH
jgi:hypothetical protein